MEEISQVTKVCKAQIAALHKAMRMDDLSPEAAKRMVADVAALLEQNSVLVGRSMGLFRASLSANPHAPAPDPPPAADSSTAPADPLLTLMSVGEQKEHLLALMDSLSQLDAMMASPHVHGSAESEGFFMERRRQLETEIMATQARLRLSTSAAGLSV
jgi:hypothetical protein